jgi:hypothetical protein
MLTRVFSLTLVLVLLLKVAILETSVNERSLDSSSCPATQGSDIRNVQSMGYNTIEIAILK